MPRERKKSKTGLFMVIFVSFIMITSIIGFLGSGQGSNKVRDHDVKFTRAGQTWVATVQGQRLQFDFLPRDVADIPFERKISSRLVAKPEIDIISDPDWEYLEDIALTQYNMGLNMDKLGVYLLAGFTGNNSFNAPVLTCSDALPSVPLFYFSSGNATKAYLEGDCILVEVEHQVDIHRMKDRIQYAFLDILE